MGSTGFCRTWRRACRRNTSWATGADGIHKTFLLRRRYFELLDQTVVGLFAGAKEFAEKTYGHELEARAHATWAESPTCDFWEIGELPVRAAQIRIHARFPVVEHGAPGRVRLRRLLRVE